MAERRMFAKQIVDSDAFLEMPLSSQALYFHLSMRGDDEGFINNPKKIVRMVNASDDDLRILISKNFIIPFESGVVVVKHWRIHNWIRQDRVRDTVYQDERKQLEVKENGAYTMPEKVDHIPLWQTDVRQMSDKCQHSIEEYSIEENRLEEYTPKKAKKTAKSSTDKPLKIAHGSFNNVFLTEDEMQKCVDQGLTDYIERLSLYIESKGVKYKSHWATIQGWNRKDIESGKGATGNRFNPKVVKPMPTYAKEEVPDLSEEDKKRIMESLRELGKKDEEERLRREEAAKNSPKPISYQEFIKSK